MPLRPRAWNSTNLDGSLYEVAEMTDGTILLKLKQMCALELINLPRQVPSLGRLHSVKASISMILGQIGYT